MLNNSFDGGVAQPRYDSRTPPGLPPIPMTEDAPKNGVNAGISMARPSVAELCLDLKELQVSRRYAISHRMKQENACAALIRRGLGFNPATQSEAEREGLKKRAQRIMAAALAGKPLEGEDKRIVDAYRDDLDATRAGLAPHAAREERIIKTMEGIAKGLPIAEWVKGVKGFGFRGLGVIVGETGNLEDYPNFRHVWKRLGLAPYEGFAASSWRSPSRSPRSLVAEEWTALGYKKSRRAEAHAFIGDMLIRQQIIGKEKSGTEFGLPKGPYGEVYVRRREHTKMTHPDWTPAHAHADALRIMTKSLIADLWSAWRRPGAGLIAAHHVAAAE